MTSRADIWPKPPWLRHWPNKLSPTIVPLSFHRSIVVIPEFILWTFDVRPKLWAAPAACERPTVSSRLVMGKYPSIATGTWIMKCTDKSCANTIQDCRCHIGCLSAGIYLTASTISLQGLLYKCLEVVLRCWTLLQDERRPDTLVVLTDRPFWLHYTVAQNGGCYLKWFASIVSPSRPV